jgi:ABC-type lipoprotein release transport system permease subunit
MAWRNIWRNPVRSLVIITSVILGLVAGIFVLGLYDGMLHDRTRTVIDTEVAHLQIHHPKFKEDYEANFTISDIDKLLNEIKSIKEVAYVTSRSIALGMLATGSGSSGIQIIGVEPQREDQVSRLNSKLVQGDGFSPQKKNQALIGRKLADKMKLKLGNKIVITFTDRNNEIVSGAFRIAGIYQTINARLEERDVYVNQIDMNRLLGLENECHEIAILLKQDELLEPGHTSVQGLAPNTLVETWKDISAETRLMIETTDQYSIIFICIIMLALMFGIINTMLMAILERTREIGMLVALGMNKFRLFALVLWETIILTLAGVPVGYLLSWLIVGYFHQQGIDISSFSGAAMSGFGFSSIIHPDFPWTKLATVFYIVAGTALFASLFPSYKALRLEPVEAMRQ